MSRCKMFRAASIQKALHGRESRKAECTYRRRQHGAQEPLTPNRLEPSLNFVKTLFNVALTIMPDSEIDHICVAAIGHRIKAQIRCVQMESHHTGRTLKRW